VGIPEVTTTMSDNHEPAFTIENLNAIGARLLDHADAITNAARRDVAADLRLAARIADKLASLRFQISEIAAKTKDHDTARALSDALTDAEAAES
jgi:hypothetical protein